VPGSIGTRTTIASALLIAETILAAPAGARTDRYTVDIPAGPLSMGLARVSELTGLSIGLAGELPRVSTARVTGRMTADALLRELLKGTGLRARRVGTTYRIDRAQHTRRAAPATGPQAVAPARAPESDIVVTAQKRRENLGAVPFSVSVVRPGSLAEGAATPSGRDISLATEGLSTTNLGPGRNRQFIRGIADSPFNGKSQSTVAVQVDDARITFDAPNPDLYLIDVDRIEILKGPQGPLYGSGALGGIYHIVTNQPDLGHASASVRISSEGVEHGGIGTGVETVVNFPLVEGTLAARVAGYRVANAGWIDSGGRKDSNSARTAGGRLALTWQPSDEWKIDVGLVLQDVDARDSQYVLISEEALTRDTRIAEPTDNDFRMIHATIERRLGSLRLVSATSIVDQSFDYTLDASGSAGSFGVTGAARFDDSRDYSVFNQEFRLSPADGRQWIVGASFLRARTGGVSTITGESGDVQIVESLDRRTSEFALFGEVSRRLFGRVDAALGARISRSVSRDLAVEQLEQRQLQRTTAVVSPSLSLSMPLRRDGIAYLRVARAKRPGGLNPTDLDGTGRFDSDKLGMIELGFRHATVGEGLSASANVHVARWDRVQSDYLLPNGLVSTRNAGRAAVIGLEASLDWHLAGGVDITAGATAQRARLTHAEDGEKLAHRRLPVAPALAGRLAIAKAIALGEWRGKMSLQANYIGGSRLSFDSDLDRTMGNYAAVAAWAELSRGGWTVSGKIDNLLDVQGDSFSFGNPFSIRKDRQFTPVRPRTLWIAITRKM
jgi:outer membrane receptor protein involved in Fe transport